MGIFWATIIHKFWYFEAGFDDSGMFYHFIIDPDDLKWEQTYPRVIYVSMSRTKTMGTFTLDNFFPQVSANYWYGSGILTTWILEGHKKYNTKKDRPKVKCLLITKQECWVEFLHKN